MERRRTGGHDHFPAFYDRQGVDGDLLRTCELRVSVWSRQLADCGVALGVLLGATILLGGPSSPRCTRRPWVPTTTRTSGRPEAGPARNHAASPLPAVMR